jgi:hypothetical protein
MLATDLTSGRDTFDRDLSLADIFRIQDEITEKVVTAIGTIHGVIRRSEFVATRDKGVRISGLTSVFSVGANTR